MSPPPFTSHAAVRSLACSLAHSLPLLEELTRSSWKIELGQHPHSIHGAQALRRPRAGAGRDARGTRGSAAATGSRAVRAGLRAGNAACAQGPSYLALPGSGGLKDPVREGRGHEIRDSSTGCLSLRWQSEGSASENPGCLKGMRALTRAWSGRRLVIRISGS